MTRALTWVLMWLGRLIFVFRLHRVVIWLNRNHVSVLLYHACETTESDFIKGLDALTTPTQFATQLDFIMRHYTVVPVTTLESGDLPPRAVVITFDDGYRSVYEHAYPLLHERSLPATTYLVTAVLDGDELVWVNEMNWLLYRHPKKCRPILATAFGVPDTAMPRAFVDRARAQYDEALIRRALDEVLGSLDPDEEKPRDAERPYVTWKEVREMKEHGMSFGNHTRSHPVMPRLDQNGMRQELNVARQAITARLGACESFAYPFGDLDSTARTIAKDAGYRSIMEVGGSNVPLDLHQVARIPVATHSVPDLFAQMEIVEPIKGRLKRLLRA